MSDDRNDPADRGVEGGGWLVWGVLVAVAIALYEIAQQPALLGVTIALKFAWGDCRTGWWIRRRDPYRLRGTAHFRLYVGYGLWKAAAAAFVLGVLFASIDNLVRRPAAAPAQQNRMFLSMVIGSVLGSLALAVVAAFACLAAFWTAGRRNFPLWLNSRVAADRVRDRWPPTQGDANAVVWMGFATGLTLMLFLVVVLLAIFLGFANKVPPAVLGFGLMGAFFLAIFRLARIVDRGGYERRVRAASPEAAWPDGE